MSALPVLRNSYTTQEDAGVQAVVLTYAVPQSRVLTATGGLTGGGDLSADRSFSLEVPVLVQNGGTGVTSFGGTNRLLYTSAVDTLTSLNNQAASVLTTNSSGTITWLDAGIASQSKVLKSDGVSAIFGFVSLSFGIGCNVTGTLAVVNGGTGLTAFGGTNTLLYTTSASTLSSIATANTSALVTSNTGVPSWTSGGTANRLLRTNGTAVTFAQADLSTDVTGTLAVGNGGTGATSFSANRVLLGNGSSAITTSANLTFASNILGVTGNLSVTNAALSLTTTQSGGIGGTPALIFTNVGATGLYSGIYFQNTGARQTSFAFTTNTSGTPNNSYSMGVDITDTGGSNFFLFDQLAVGTCLVFDDSRRLGLRGIVSPSAVLHIPAGSDAVGDGQLKFDGSALLAIPETGVMEFDGDHLFFTPSTGNRNAVLYTEGVTAGAVTPDGQIVVVINGASYAIATQAV